MCIEDAIDCPHTLRVLKKAGITTMEELAERSREDLLKLRGVGPVIADGLEAALERWRRDRPEGDGD